MQRQPDNNQVAVLLLAFGGPANLNEIEPFLKNILCGRPAPPTLVEDVCRRYKMIGGASPLPGITGAQARALKKLLQGKGRDIDVYYAMRFWRPFIPDVLTELEQEGVKRLLYLIMSPYCTPASTGGYDRAVHDWEQGAIRQLRAFPVTGWHVHPLYLDALSRSIKQCLAAFPSHRHKHVHIIFTAHSLPEAQLSGDPYVPDLLSAVKRIVDRLQIKNHHLAFQSRGRENDAWLGPDPKEVIEDAVLRGVREILLVPLGFIADHLETLYDIDIVLQDRAQELGVHLVRSPSLNDDPLFIEALAETILDTLEKPLP